MAREACLSGTNVVFVRVLLHEHLGAEGVERLKSSLPADVRDRYFGATSLDWVPVADVNLMNERAAQIMGIAVAEFTATMGRLSIERTLRTLWRLLLRFTSDEAIVTRTPVLYSKSFDTGRLSTEILRPGIARIRLVDWPDVPQLTLVGITAGIETVLRVAGRENVTVTLQRTAEGAEFSASWRVGRDASEAR